MKVAIYSHTPIACAPFLQFQCLQKYAGNKIQVRFIQRTNQYRDGRLFPKDLLFHEPAALLWLKEADVIHIHNYLPRELSRRINRQHQKVIATFHSVPRQGNWQELMRFSAKNFVIRQPLQMREYKNFSTLPNLFDIWSYTKPPLKTYTGTLNIVYCPTNKNPNTTPGTKGFLSVMPILDQLKKEHGDEINIISHSNMEYYENLRQKALGHITIDDIIGETFHLTSLEACCTGQAILTSTPPSWHYPFVYTTLQTLKERLDYLINHREFLEFTANLSRTWLEKNWNPKAMVNEYIDAYTK